MAGRPKVWTPETERWLIKTAWKKLTLQEIALKINVNVTVIKNLYDEYEIKPITKRDRIASKILDIYNNTNPFPKVSELALMLNCSGPLVKSIIDDFGLTASKQQHEVIKSKVKQQTKLKLKAMEDYDLRMAAQKELRKTLTSYTQSSSDLIDHCRQMQTTLRPNTYLTNNG